MSQEIDSQIQEIISRNSVVLFMKGTKKSPLCGFSSYVVKCLQHFQVDFMDVNVLDSNEMREGIKKFSDWPTIPQLYIKGEFIGGKDIVNEMVESGEFIEMLKQKDIAFE